MLPTKPPFFLHYVSTINNLIIITDQSSTVCCCCCCFFLILFYTISVFVHFSFILKKVSMDPVHDSGSMDPVHESGPWTQSKVGPCFVLACFDHSVHSVNNY